MPLLVEHKPLEPFGSWPCFFCKEDTAYWTALPERSGADQEACCPNCATMHDVSELPDRRYERLT